MRYSFNALTGGARGAVDEVSHTLLTPGQDTAAAVIPGGQVYFYEVIATTDPENSPALIRPDSGGDIGWQLVSVYGAGGSVPEPTAASDFLAGVDQGGGVFGWAVKTLAQVKTLLGLGSAAYTSSSDYDATGSAGSVQSNLNTHLGDTAPHFGAISQAAAEAGTSEALGWWSPARIKQAIQALAPQGGGEWTEVARYSIPSPVGSVSFLNVFTDAWAEYRVRLIDLSFSPDAYLYLKLGYGTPTVWMGTYYCHTDISGSANASYLGNAYSPQALGYLSYATKRYCGELKLFKLRALGNKICLFEGGADSATSVRRGSGVIMAADSVNKASHLLLQAGNFAGGLIIIEGRNQ